jgi:hypothetical protein
MHHCDEKKKFHAQQQQQQQFKCFKVNVSINLQGKNRSVMKVFFTEQIFD